MSVGQAVQGVHFPEVNKYFFFNSQGLNISLSETDKNLNVL